MDSKLTSTDKKLVIELAILLVLKLCLLFLIWNLFFSSPPANIDADSVADTLLDSSSSGDTP